MKDLAQTPSRSCSWPITVGAEGIVAAQFARCGFDVLVQAGRDKPWYDLVVTKSGNLLRVSVKASEDGQWSLAQGYTRRALEISGKKPAVHGAIDLWLDSHGSRTVCCLVQFEGVTIHELPRVYLASPHEIAQKMRETAAHLGECILHERYETETGEQTALPTEWLFSQERIEELLASQASAMSGAAKPPQRATDATWPAKQAALHAVPHLVLSA